MLLKHQVIATLNIERHKAGLTLLTGRPSVDANYPATCGIYGKEASSVTYGAEQFRL